MKRRRFDRNRPSGIGQDKTIDNLTGSACVGTAGAVKDAPAPESMHSVDGSVAQFVRKAFFSLFQVLDFGQ